jgi:hypothetical protein
MIIPTADFDPMFAEDGVPFRAKMIAYIRQEFADLLGPRLGLLRHDEGLEILADMFFVENRESPGRKAA